MRKKTIIIGRADQKKTIEVPIPTISGLAHFLGFESRQSFYDYEKKDGFSYTVKRARLFIEVHYEEMLNTGNVTGAIFALKNLGWLDETKVVQINKEAKPLTPEEQQELNKNLEDTY